MTNFSDVPKVTFNGMGLF